MSLFFCVLNRRAHCIAPLRLSNLAVVPFTNGIGDDEAHMPTWSNPLGLEDRRSYGDNFATERVVGLKRCDGRLI